MALIDQLVVFVVSLLVGALGIYVGARVLTGVEDYTYALVTALVASAVLVLVNLLFGWIPFLGPLLALVVYLGVINYRYPGGWFKAIGIALIAWVASLAVLYLLALLDLASSRAIGVVGA